MLPQQAGLPRASAPSSLIDLHTHTQASDGRLSPRDLVHQAWLAGIRVLGITDHDTIGGLAAAHPAAREFGVRVVDGVEVTAIENERDVHVLGYLMDVSDAPFVAFLAEQRQARATRSIASSAATVRRSCRAEGRR